MPVTFEHRPVDKPQHKRGSKTAKQRGAISNKVRKLLEYRSQGSCERCGRGGIPLQAAHITRRWKLAETTVNDLLHLCVPCHQWSDGGTEGRKWLESKGKEIRSRG